MRIFRLILSGTLAASLLSGCSKDPAPSKGGAKPAAPSADLSSDADKHLRAQLEQHSQVPDPAAETCATCHPNETAAWKKSQHAHANRLVHPGHDLAAFQNTSPLIYPGFTNTFHHKDGVFSVHQTGPDGTTSTHPAAAVIGIDPLVQYLTAFPGGRLQTIDAAHDPRSNEFFHVFGDDIRHAHEWGFWKNRSMTWNVQCAFCHTTNYQKNYDHKTDSYFSTWDAMGVSCTQCHGDMTAHKANPSAPVLATEKISRDRAMDNCASCHSRREELTGAFRPGESYHDHYRLSLADGPGLYHPDGQIRDEVFEYGSFQLSRMGHKGVHCLDCHNPHSGELLLPVENNALCMSCHAPPGRLGAKPISDIAAHSHHAVGSTGSRCVECHMSETKYMVRDPRRDHAFTIPDPLLTKELGIPNACNKCHTDKDVDWAIQWTDTWYGDAMDRPARHRARAIARAGEYDPAVVPELLRLLDAEEVDAWKASLIGFLAPWAGEPQVRNKLTPHLTHTNALVRSTTTRVLAPVPEARRDIAPLRDDPTRLVRLDATWATWDPYDRTSTQRKEFETYLDTISDQPAGALRRAQAALADGHGAEAEKWARKTIAWDPAAYSYEMLARILHVNGKLPDAIEAMRSAAELAPQNVDIAYSIALLLGEAQQPTEATKQLEKVVQLDRSFARAWYNLGLAYAGENRDEEAIKALLAAQELLPQSADPLYAVATIHLGNGAKDQAQRAAESALMIDRTHQGAMAVLRQIMQGGNAQPPTP